MRLELFRSDLHACFTRRTDALLELGDGAAVRPSGPVASAPIVSLEPVHQRRWGSSSYAALACGRIDAERLRDLLASSLPDADRLVFALM